MGAVKGLAVAGVAAAGTIVGLSALEKMDSEDIRSCGEKVSNFVSNAADNLQDSDLYKSLVEKLNQTKYGPAVLGVLDKAGDGLGPGLGNLISAVADTKDQAAQDGTSFVGAASMKLLDAVSSGANFVSEKLSSIPSGSELGADLANKYLAHQNQGETPEVENSGLEVEV